MGQKKLGLSLRGGGAKTASYIGALKAFEEEEIKIDLMVGCSAGSIVGAMYAIGRSLDEITNWYINFTWKKYLRLESLHDMCVVGDGTVVSIAQEALGDFKEEDLKIPIWFQATNMDSGKLEYLREGNFATAIAASCSAPLLMKPIEHLGKTYLDGGIVGSSGTDFLRVKGAQVVVTFGTGLEYDGDFAHLGILNRLLIPLTIAIKSSTDIDLKLNPPDYDLENLGVSYGLMEYAKAEEIAQHGYELTKEKMKDIKKVIFKRTIFNLFS